MCLFPPPASTFPAPPCGSLPLVCGTAAASAGRAGGASARAAGPCSSAHLRCGHIYIYAQLATGFGVGTTTAYRYIAEAVEVLADRAPALAEAMKTASTKAFVMLDGTLLPIDQIAADRPF